MLSFFPCAVIANGICKKLWLRKVPHITNIVFPVEESGGIFILSNIASRNSGHWETLVTEHRIFSTLLHPLAKQINFPKDILAFPIGASSTDRDLAENVINTLTPIDRYPRGASYWSSKGEIDPNVPENIMYRLNAGISIVTEVNIRPFEGDLSMNALHHFSHLLLFTMIFDFVSLSFSILAARKARLLSKVGAFSIGSS